jgi:hypothetical protein
MTAEEHNSIDSKAFRLRVTTDGDPSVLPRLLGQFQNLNVTPCRVVAELAPSSVMNLEVDVCGVPEGCLSLIAAKIAHNPCVLNVCWHRLSLAVPVAAE